MAPFLLPPQPFIISVRVGGDSCPPTRPVSLSQPAWGDVRTAFDSSLSLLLSVESDAPVFYVLRGQGWGRQNPVVYVSNDQRVMGIILRYVCWGTHGAPPPIPPWTPAIDRPTYLPPLPDPQKFSHTVGCQDSNGPPPLMFRFFFEITPPFCKK